MSEGEQKIDIRKRLIRGSAVRTFNLMLSVVVAFWMMPYIVGALGDRMYGIWIIIGSFVSYYGLLDLGLSTAVTRFIARSLGRKDHEEIRTIICTSFYLYSFIGLIGVILSLLLLILGGRFASTPEDARLFRWLLFIMGLNFSLGFPVRVFTGIMNAHLAYDVAAGVTIIKAALNAALTVVLLENGFGLLALAYLNFGLSLFDSSVRIWMAYRIEPNITLSWKYFQRSWMKSLFNYSIYSFVSQMAELLRFRVAPWVIGGFLGAGFVTHYSVASRMMDYFRDLMTSLMGTLSPVFSQYDGKENRKAIVEKLLLTTKFSTTIAVGIGGFTVLYGHPFIARWMGPQYLDAYPALLFLMIPMILSLLQTPGTSLLYAISRHRFLAAFNLIEGITNLCLSLWLIHDHGILGVAIATGIPIAFVKIFIQPIYLCRSANVPLLLYLKASFGTLIVSAVLLLAPWIAIFSHVKAEYLSLVFFGSINMIVYGYAVLVLVLRPSERIQISPKLQSLAIRMGSGWIDRILTCPEGRSTSGYF